MPVCAQSEDSSSIKNDSEYTDNQDTVKQTPDQIIENIQQQIISEKYDALKEVSGEFISDKENYEMRTKINVRDSDGTLILVPELPLPISIGSIFHSSFQAKPNPVAGMASQLPFGDFNLLRIEKSQKQRFFHHHYYSLYSGGIYFIPQELELQVL